MKMPVAFGGSMLLVRSSQTRIVIRTTWCSLPKAQRCALPRRSIRYRCCMRQRRMAKCRLEPLHYRTRRPTPWTCGMTLARPRVSSGNGQVMILACQRTFVGFLLRTRMRSPTEDGNRECGCGRLKVAKQPRFSRHPVYGRGDLASPAVPSQSSVYPCCPGLGVVRMKSPKCLGIVEWSWVKAPLDALMPGWYDRASCAPRSRWTTIYSQG
jgi:hypothetical protein